MVKTKEEVKEALDLISFSMRQCFLWKNLLVKNGDIWGVLLMDREIQVLRALILGIQWTVGNQGGKDIKDLVIELAEKGNSNSDVN